MRYFIQALILCIFFSSSAYALTGNKKLACEAILCLAAVGSPPKECKKPLKKYFSIVIKSSLGSFKPGKTLKARKNFLKLCPKADTSNVNALMSKG